MRRRDFVIVLLGASGLSLRTARAEHRSVGFLSAGTPDAYASFVAAFRARIAEKGYVEDRNLAIEFRWAEGHYDRLAELANDLVHKPVEVIASCGGDDPDCVHQRRRSRREGVRDEPRAARSEYDGDVPSCYRVGSEAAGACARSG